MHTQAGWLYWCQNTSLLVHLIADYSNERTVRGMSFVFSYPACVMWMQHLSLTSTEDEISKLALSIMVQKRPSNQWSQRSFFSGNIHFLSKCCTIHLFSAVFCLERVACGDFSLMMALGKKISGLVKAVIQKNMSNAPEETNKSCSLTKLWTWLCS